MKKRTSSLSLVLCGLTLSALTVFAAEKKPEAEQVPPEKVALDGRWVGNKEAITFVSDSTYVLPPEKAIHTFTREKNILTLSSFQGEENVKAFIIENEFARMLKVTGSDVTLFQVEEREWKKEEVTGVWKYTTVEAGEYREDFRGLRKDDGTYAYYFLSSYPDSKTYEFYPDYGTWTLTKQGVLTEKFEDMVADVEPTRIQLVRKGKDWFSWVLLDQEEPFPLSIERKAKAEDIFMRPPRGYTPDSEQME